MTDRRKDNLGYWCHEAARAHAGRTALVDLSRAQPREVTYRELEERLDRFAAMIVAAGLRPGDRMAMAIGNRFEFVEVMFGAMRAGVVPVPMNTKLGADTLAYVLADSGAVAAVVDPAANRSRPRPPPSSRRSWRLATCPSCPTPPARPGGPRAWC